MKIFAVICLIVILIAIQHLTNWAFRALYSDFENDDERGGTLTATLFLLTIVGIITFFAGKYLILWAYPLF